MTPYIEELLEVAYETLDETLPAGTPVAMETMWSAAESLTTALELIGDAATKLQHDPVGRETQCRIALAKIAAIAALLNSIDVTGVVLSRH
jgi:hypothetical protein